MVAILLNEFNGLRVFRTKIPLLLTCKVSFGVHSKKYWIAWCKTDPSNFFGWNFFLKSTWIFACAFQFSCKTFGCIILGWFTLSLFLKKHNWPKWLFRLNFFSSSEVPEYSRKKSKQNKNFLLLHSLCMLWYFVLIFLRDKVQTSKKQYRGSLVYKSQQPANFGGFSARFRWLLSLLHESRYVEEMFITSYNCLLFTKLWLLKNLKKTLHGNVLLNWKVQV